MTGTNNPLVIIAGPTAVGKSEIAIALAKEIEGAVISADSMQVYRGLDIGTAKIKPKEMQGIPHYLVDILPPDEEFHVVRFQQLAKKAIEEIYEMERIPIICGGTGFYIQALLYDIDFKSQPDDSTYREGLMRIAGEGGGDRLYEQLKQEDPEAADLIHPNNTKRVIRALEFLHFSGDKISAHNAEEHDKEAAYNAAYFCLTMDRKKLYQRINDRVDAMIDAGLEEEVRSLAGKGFHKDMVSMQGIGYHEMMEYFDGEITRDEAVQKIKTESRHYAKRQLTWMRRERDVIWIDRDEYPLTDEVVRKMVSVLREKEILS